MPRLSILLIAGLALTLGPVRAQPHAPDVTWEFLGPEYPTMAIALLDPLDGAPFGLAEEPLVSTFDAVFRLVDPAGGHIWSEAWTTLGHGVFGRTLYADSTGFIITGIGAGPHSFVRSTDGGRTWEGIGSRACEPDGVEPFIVRTYGPARERSLWISGSAWCRSDDEGRTWTVLPTPEPPHLRQLDVAEVPASDTVPTGRMLLAVGGGVLVSDDGVAWRASSLHGDLMGAGERYVASSFAVARDSGHPYGATVYVAVNLGGRTGGPYVAVFASEDAGETWTERAAFADGDLGLAYLSGYERIVALGDGSLVMGLSNARSGATPNDRGVVVWSGDGGRTWAELGPRAPWAGEHPPMEQCDPPGGQCPDGLWPGWAAKQVAVDREGRVWVGTDHGVWRTSGPAWAVAEESAPAPQTLSVAVWPNPTASGATVEVSAPSRVEIVDALGREVAAWDGVRRVEIDTSGWAPGAYVVRVESAGGARATAGLAVAR